MSRRQRRQNQQYATVPTAEPSASSPERHASSADVAVEAPQVESFVLTRSLMLQLLGVVYCVAFLGAYFQNRALIGERGLSPTKFSQHRQSVASPLEGFTSHPAIWWWVHLTDDSMDAVALAGTVLSALVALGGQSWLIMLVLWLLYFSIVTAAESSTFYQYGWESQLLETGFLAVFLCEGPVVPLLDALLPFGSARAREPSLWTLWLFRWLCFRISMGAGLIKMRGGSCWQAKTCLHYHFETQPIPSPLSFGFHFLPHWVLSRAVDLDLLVQFYTSCLVLIPGVAPPLRALRRLGGVLQVVLDPNPNPNPNPNPDLGGVLQVVLQLAP